MVSLKGQCHMVYTSVFFIILTHLRVSLTPCTKGQTLRGHGHRGVRQVSVFGPVVAFKGMGGGVKKIS